ncbi:MAG: aminotransferase class III-fold pyridoxal phosphate-dependent enzyme, partial [Bacteroidetes bacterium]|nr:aminotransferase class III-fold pyridoxal phosphate-dependent enzyme [Bacteroidota bacterium]
LREACGLDAFPGSSELTDWLRLHQPEFPDIMRHDSCVVFDFSVGSSEFSPDEIMKPGLVGAEILTRMRSSGADLGIGRYDEPRLVYTSDRFETPSGNQRTIHLGLDLFQQEGSVVHAPIDGTVHSVRDNNLSADYGPTVILCHEPEGGPVFYTLYGHLSRNSIRELVVGAGVSAGDPLATLGDFDENGGWAPHLHFQIIGDLLDSDGNFPGVATPEEREVWKSLCPDPNLVCNLSLEQFPEPEMNRDEILRVRSSLLGPSLSLSYTKPLHIVRGFMQHLYDADGRRFLDCVNNVPHVGHSNPRVVEAGASQLRTLTTNTRYLHANLVRYADRLTATMPEPLNVIFFVNSGSEANDLALRIARAHTNTRHMIVIEGSYHGNLSSLIDLSHYKYDGSGGAGAPPTTHAAIMPDTYRGKHRGPNAATMYADHVAELVSKLNIQGESANIIAESALSCGGQIFFPEGYLPSVYDSIRAQGGVCIADEVHVGLGRLGSHFWGFQAEGVVPDIVTIGKPVGNGHPMGAVVTTKELADSFSNGMEYFNTFGGNPVSCAIGMAVLDEIDENDLQTHALVVGTYFLERLRDLAEQHKIIGDVRGRGLFIGIELVRDSESLEPADEEASYVVNRMLEKGILLATDGPLKNVIKIKPPLVFTEENADHVVNSLDEVLREDVVRGAFR